MTVLDFDGVKARVTQHAFEAIQEVFHRMPWDQEIIVGGQPAIIKKFVAPKLRCEEDSNNPLKQDPHFGFDVKAKDGSWHLEFYVYQTGWGGNPNI